MRSLQGSIRRVFHHIDYIMGLQARLLYIFTVIFAVIVSYAFYTSPGLAISMLPFVFLIYAAMVSALATEPIDEVSKGTIQVYLATGLTREEYYEAWLLGGIAFQTLVFVLIYCIPAFIINPRIFFIIPSNYGLSVPMGSLIVVGALQITYYGATAMTVGALTKKRSLAVLSVFLLMVIIPFLVGIILSILAPDSAEYITYFVMLFCNQLFYTGMTSYNNIGVFGLNPVIESIIVLVVLDVVLILISNVVWRRIEI
ncbi:MAG: hypothetical protein GXO43_07880 [Crenarchaeota archaeon]|nr:hypothetical protein [Thermoproteota archaeon]